MITLYTTKIAIETTLLFFMKYKNEQKERECWRQRNRKKWLL